MELPDYDVWMSHGDRVSALPPGFQHSGQSPNAPIAAMADPTRHFYGVQFHPEVTHTKQGQAMLRRFLREVCSCQALWTAANIVDDAVETVRRQVGSGKVLLGLSGGVDSSVVAALLHRAIGDQLVCVFVDNGLLRLKEGDEVMEAFRQAADDSLALNIIRVDTEAEFLGKLAGESDPERKRKIIGRPSSRCSSGKLPSLRAWSLNLPCSGHFGNCSIGLAPRCDRVRGLQVRQGPCQGGTKKSHRIHNVGGLPERMKLELVEPLRELFKDEVRRRRFGLALGLPERLIFRFIPSIHIDTDFPKGRAASILSGSICCARLCTSGAMEVDGNLS